MACWLKEMQHIKWHFGDFIFAPHLQLLLRKHAHTEYRQRLSAAEAAILDQLLAHCGQLCDKDNLTTIAWQGRPVSAQSLPVAIATLRKYLDSGEHGLEIKNIPRKGYLIEIDSELREELIPETQTSPAEMVPQDNPLPVPGTFGVAKWVKYLAANNIANNIFVAGCALLLLLTVYFFYSVWIPVSCQQAGEGYICSVSDKQTHTGAKPLPGNNQVMFISGESSVTVNIQEKTK
ncbi:DNA-binding winged helix-turn-helix (wHTH) protein [Mangrovibacter plantisponsor]|uniref:DNA-binding winged helix-turn-helix (WHTH) protein n=2 Tax=Mangrovibacter plantisponsor TaxID=451513 RepID=A0A317Q2H7_9ENTR|nr:DNA-binding winged helix-turn-helix (wHTH) protein [Mangrovibacter plantisponsor]